MNTKTTAAGASLLATVVFVFLSSLGFAQTGPDTRPETADQAPLQDLPRFLPIRRILRESSTRELQGFRAPPVISFDPSIDLSLSRSKLWLELDRSILQKLEHNQDQEGNPLF